MNNSLLYDLLKEHHGHSVEIAMYDDCICLEDTDTNEIIFDSDLYTVVLRNDIEKENLYQMGWTSYHADFYKPNGKIDIKAECRNYFTGGLNEGYYKVVKDILVGNTYYAAATVLKKYVKEKDSFEPLPIEEQKTYAFVILTSVNSKDFYNFSMKVIDETMGPCNYDCVGILKYLSPIESEFANNWRKEVKKRADEQTQLKKLPIGTKIKFSKWTLTKSKVYSNKSPLWLTPNFTYVPTKRIHSFEIVEVGNGF